MNRYERCEQFGANDCCGTHQQRTIDRIKHFAIDLDFRDGTTIRIHPWIVSNVQELDDHWYAQRLQNPDYEEIDVTTLTQGSRVRYAKYHHWGVITTPKRSFCPFK